MIAFIQAAAMGKIMPATHLKACKLWEGSMLQGNFKYGGITAKDLMEAHNRLERCDDRTEAEEEWLAAILKTLKEAGFEPIA